MTIAASIIKHTVKLWLPLRMNYYSYFPIHELHLNVSFILKKKKTSAPFSYTSAMIEVKIIQKV